MKTVFRYFIKNYRLVLLMSLFIVVIGIQGLKSVKRETRPPVDFASASIMTVYPGSSPEEVEENVTDRIEKELQSVEGIKDVSSTSQAGLSKIVARVDMDNYDSQRVLDDIQRSLQRVTRLPQDLLDPPLFTHFNAKEIPILRLALIGSNENRKRDLLIRDLESMVEDDPGVSSVRFGGFLEREYQILLDSKKMNQFHVGIDEVVNAVKRRTQNIPAGLLKIPDDQRLVRVVGQIESAKELEDVVVRSNFSGQNITIKDIAKVKDHMEDPTVLVRVNGKPATTFTVTKSAQADSIKTVERIQKYLDEFKSKLGETYEVIVYNDEASRIYNRLKIVVDNALFGLVLVLVILFLFLPGNLGAMASLSLPLSLLATVGIMPFIGVNFNNITLLAFVIALGMLVDNSVVISENYARLRFEGKERLEAAVQAAHQFWLPIVATVATTIVAFLPMLVTTGVMGQFIKWIPIMVTIALLASLVESFLLLPARLQFTIRELPNESDDKKKHKTQWFDNLRDRFETMMLYLVEKRYWVGLAITLLLTSSIIVAIKGNRFELFPSEHTEYYYATFEMPITSTLEQTDNEAGRLADDVIKAIGNDVVEYVISNTGESQVGFRDPQAKSGSNVGMITIAVPLEVAQITNTQDVLDKLRSIPKGNFKRLNFVEARHGPPVGSPLSVTLKAKDYDVLQDVVKDLRVHLDSIDGVVDVIDDQLSGGLEYQIIPNHDVIRRLNLDTQTIGQALRAALQGTIAAELSQAGEAFNLRIRYDDQDRATIDSIKRTKIMEPSRQLIPLSGLVQIIPSEGPKIRKHYNFKRSVTVNANVIPAKITSVVLNQKVKAFLDKKLENKPGIKVTYGGEQESTKESTTSLKNAMVLAVFGIFGILVFLFGRFMQPLLVLSCIPLGLVGVSWAFFIHQRPLSFLALIGVVGLAGVVVNSAIVLISYINDLKQEQTNSLHEILAKASANRLRAVMVTSLTTVGGLFPTAYGIGGYDSALVPMTLALAWGLVSGTLLTLIWVPCAYGILEDLSVFIKGLLKRTNFESTSLNLSSTSSGEEI